MLQTGHTVYNQAGGLDERMYCRGIVIAYRCSH